MMVIRTVCFALLYLFALLLSLVEGFPKPFLARVDVISLCIDFPSNTKAFMIREVIRRREKSKREGGRKQGRKSGGALLDVWRH